MASIYDNCKQYIKDHKFDLINKFANPEIYFPADNPIAYFMAGSPGAGKTETSKAFIKALELKEPNRKIIRIDADEIRDFIPYYNRKNAIEVQGGAFLGLQKLLDYAFSHKLDFLLDGTFSDYDKAYQNISRCLDHKRKTAIIYLYQEPKIAWEFTLKREALEGRPIPKDFFIDSFFRAKENVNKIKSEYGKRIELNLYIKNIDQSLKKAHFNIDNVDHFLKIRYTNEQLNTLL